MKNTKSLMNGGYGRLFLTDDGRVLEREMPDVPYPHINDLVNDLGSPSKITKKAPPTRKKIKKTLKKLGYALEYKIPLKCKDSQEAGIVSQYFLHRGCYELANMYHVWAIDLQMMEDLK